MVLASLALDRGIRDGPREDVAAGNLLLLCSSTPPPLIPSFFYDKFNVWDEIRSVSQVVLEWSWRRGRLIAAEERVHVRTLQRGTFSFFVVPRRRSL